MEDRSRWARVRAGHQDHGHAQADGHGEAKMLHGTHGCQTRLLSRIGTGNYAFQCRQADSWEGWYWGAKHIWGMDPFGNTGKQTNLAKDVAENADALLFWGCDPETTPRGWGGEMPSRYEFFLHDVGVKQIHIAPDVNYANAVHADKWIPVLPNTDAALQLAIAYVWLTEGTYDEEYLRTHAIGFENWAFYVMGGEDGVPKTPKWAEARCGVPSYTIKALARYWAKHRVSIGHCNGGSYIRAAFSHEPARLEVALLGMQGLGQPGCNQMLFTEFGLFSSKEVNIFPGGEEIPNVGGAYRGREDIWRENQIPKTMVPQGLRGDHIEWRSHLACGLPRDDQFTGPFEYPLPTSKAGVKMIWSDAPCWTTCWNGGNTFQDAVRNPDIEFYMVQHIWMENDCNFADLLLPVTTKFEDTDISTDDEWIKLGFESNSASEHMTYEEFKEVQSYVVPTRENWQDEPAGLIGFYNAPAFFPLKTPSGKLEYYSTALAQVFPDDTERGPIPRWVEESDEHKDRITSERAKKYPFLLVSNHPRWRIHAQFDDVTWFREIKTCKVTGPDGYKYEPIWINPVDAARMGVKTGDVARLFNERGSVLGGVYVTERIMPGVVYQDHGARTDTIVAGVGGLDRGVANNLICPSAVTSKNCAGEVTSGFLVGCEKVDVFALAEKYPEAFNRPYDPDTGLIAETRFGVDYE